MNQEDYARLSPDLVLDAIESLGYLSDARVLALNSYENRVYQIGIEDETPIIAKFYRPGRWSDEQIAEEHEFTLALTSAEIPIIAPIQRDGKSLFEYQGYRFAIFPRRGGYAPELENLDTLYTLGQHLGRLHAVGKVKNFDHRPSLNIESFGETPREFILTGDFLPTSLREAYETLSRHILDKLSAIIADLDFELIRIHGDCHPGNILVRPDSMYLVDLDDARNGPAVQDIWMLLSGDRMQRTAQLESILEGYEEFCKFAPRELVMIEALRALRMIHYAGWLAKRWQDPAFPLAFPWFNSERYWAEHILELREQMAELDDAPLTLQPY